MRKIGCWLLIIYWAILPGIAGAAIPTDLAAVVGARAELGDQHWNAVLLIRNGCPDRPYPRDTYALVFEFVDALWFYCPVDGTRPFSVKQHQVAADQAAMGPLLRRIDRGFTDWRPLTPAELAAVAAAAKPLPNGCFVESLGEARRREARGELSDARLLSYYVGERPNLHGHTVLCFENDDGAQVYDPADGKVQRLFGRLREFTPTALAERLLSSTFSGRVVQALAIALGRGA
jgi:hypothetical protein